MGSGRPMLPTSAARSPGYWPDRHQRSEHRHTALVPSNGATVPGILTAAYYGANPGVGPGAAGLENIFLVSRDPQNVVRPYVRQYKPLDLFPTTASPDSMPYALITDTTFAVRAPKFLGRASRVAVSV